MSAAIAGAYQVSFKFWLNIIEELFKVKYLIKPSQYFENLQRQS